MKTISKQIDKDNKSLVWSLEGVDRRVTVWIPLNQLMRFEDDEMMDMIKTVYNDVSPIDIDPLKGSSDLVGVEAETMIDLGEKKAYLRFIVEENNHLAIDTIELKSNEYFIDFLARRSSNFN